jgi:hypothetical protein
MPKHDVSAGGHQIRIETSYLTGSERIVCDGQVVSAKTSMFYLTPHSFQLDEGGESVTYEVNVLSSMFGFDHGYIVRRNGVILAHRP